MACPRELSERSEQVGKKKGKYKLKTHKATAKRFRVTASGAVVRTKGGKSHLRRKKSRRAKAQFDNMLLVEEQKIARRVRRLAPYLGRHKANPNARSGS
jgi:large subunit ribosomal protein L35